jgi:hypothetical protein
MDASSGAMQGTAQYLETMVNTDSSIEKEFKERIPAGNITLCSQITIHNKINIQKRQIATL